MGGDVWTIILISIDYSAQKGDRKVTVTSRIHSQKLPRTVLKVALPVP